MEPVKERVIRHLKLAQVIASKYFNIPGITREEAISEAQAALVRASSAYDPSKGPFSPFAGSVIRNALNSLYHKQLKHVKMMVKSLDETIHGVSHYGTQIGNLGQNIADSKANVVSEIKMAERKKILQKCVNGLSPKEKKVVYYIAQGHSLKEISEINGVTKQAIFKVWINAKNKIFSQLKKYI